MVPRYSRPSRNGRNCTVVESPALLSLIDGVGFTYRNSLNDKPAYRKLSPAAANWLRRKESCLVAMRLPTVPQASLKSSQALVALARGRPWCDGLEAVLGCARGLLDTLNFSVVCIP